MYLGARRVGGPLTHTTHPTVEVSVTLMKSAGSSPQICIVCGFGLFEFGL